MAADRSVPGAGRRGDLRHGEADKWLQGEMAAPPPGGDFGGGASRRVGEAPDRDNAMRWQKTF